MDARGRDSVSGASSLGPDSLVFRRGGARHENLNHGLMFYNAIKFFACKRRSKSLGVIWWRLQWRRRWEKKKKVALFWGVPLGNPAPTRKSGYNTVSSCYLFLYSLPDYEWVIALLSLEQKKPNEKEKESFTKLVSFPGPPRGKKKVLALFDTGKIAALRIYGCYSVSA